MYVYMYMYMYIVYVTGVEYGYYPLTHLIVVGKFLDALDHGPGKDVLYPGLGSHV